MCRFVTCCCCCKMLSLQFIYSVKATKFCEIFPLLLNVCIVVKSKGKISQSFVAFSEYMNFTVLISQLRQYISGPGPPHYFSSCLGFWMHFMSGPLTIIHPKNWSEKISCHMQWNIVHCRSDCLQEVAKQKLLQAKSVPSFICMSLLPLINKSAVTCRVTRFLLDEL